MEAALVMRAAGQSERHATRDLIPRDDGGEQVGPGGAGHFGGGDGGGDDRRAGMQRAGGVRVIKIQRMRQRAVQQRRADRAVARRVAEDAGLALPQAQGAHGGQHRRGAFGIVAGADDVADQIEQQEAGAGDHVGRQVRQFQIGAVVGQDFGDGHAGAPLLPALLVKLLAKGRSCRWCCHGRRACHRGRPAWHRRWRCGRRREWPAPRTAGCRFGR